MDTSKHGRGDSDEHAQAEKRLLVRLDDDQTELGGGTVEGGLTADPPKEQISIEIKVRSTTKAARNDPRPPEDPSSLSFPEFRETALAPTEEGASLQATLQGDETSKEETREDEKDKDEMEEDAMDEDAMDKDEMDEDEMDDNEMDDNEMYEYEMDEYEMDEYEMDEYEMDEYEESEDEADMDSTESIASELDEHAELKWLEPIDGFVILTSPDGAKREKIGYCEGKLMRRYEIRPVFYFEMEQPSRETSSLAFDMFDRYGRFKKEYKEHPIKKGSGIWREELDHGDILLIEYLHIQKPYRRRGLGRKLVMAMLEKARAKSSDFVAITWPAMLWRETEKEMEGADEATRDTIFDREQDIAIGLFRSIGFRRVGSTRWFAFASDKKHPCHSLAAKDDYNPPALQMPVSNIQPLIEKVGELEDTAAVAELEQYIKVIPANDLSWLVTDRKGNSILHVAAIKSKPRTIGWIMSQDFGPRLLEMRNAESNTALEALLDVLERSRTQWEVALLTIVVSDKFEGHDPASVASLAKLKGLTQGAATADIQRLALGCTCGQCISGFLSPRMRLALECEADLSCDMLLSDTDGFFGLDWVDWWAYKMEYLPASVRNNLRTNKSMRQGYAQLFGHFATTVRKGVPPRRDQVLSVLRDSNEWPPCSKNFLQRGGTVDSVATMIFQSAMVQDLWAGDGEHYECLKDQIEALPECRNDHEFGFVSGMCGYPRVSRTRY